VINRFATPFSASKNIERGPGAYKSAVMHAVLVILYATIRVTARMNAHHILDTSRKGHHIYFGIFLGSYGYRNSSCNMILQKRKHNRV
jgi:hypothetical protein